MTDEALARLGQRVRRRRAELGLSQQELAAASNTTRQLISRLEKGNADVSLHRLARIAEALGLQLELRDPSRSSTSLIPETTLNALRSFTFPEIRLDDSMRKAMAEALHRSAQAFASAPKPRGAEEHSALALGEAPEHGDDS